MADARARLAALAAKLYETRPDGIELCTMVPGRTWVLVGRQGKRWWVKYTGYRDELSITALDGHKVIVLRHIHVLQTWTMPEEPTLESHSPR